MKTWHWVLLVGLVAIALSGGAAEAAVMTLDNRGRLSPAQILQLASNAGFTGNDLTIAGAIALAESGGDPNAHGDLTLGTKTGSFGLWQIYSDAHPEYGPDFTQLFDPQTNANAAFAIYNQAHQSFHPWSTWGNGAYAKFMSTVQDSMNA